MFSQTNYYVSLTGNNNNNGSFTQPFKTIFKASQVAQPGDNVYVMGGIYRNTDFNDNDIWVGSSAGRIVCNGAPNQYITFQPYQDQEVIFEFDANYGIQITNSSYVIFRGFTVKGIAENITQTEAQNNWGLYMLNNQVYTIVGNENLLPLPSGISKPSYYNGRGLVANSSHHIILEDNIVYNCPSSGIRIEQSDYAIVRRNVVYNNTFWTTQGVGAITMAESTNIDTNNSYKIIVEKNLVYNNENRMISWNPNKSFITYEIDEGAGIFMTRNADTYLNGGFKISNNIVYNCGTGGVICHFTNNALINHNSLYYNGTTGYGNSGGIGVNTTQNVTIANNIIYARPNKWAIGTLSPSHPNLLVTNNIVYNENGIQVNNVISSGFVTSNPLYLSSSGYNFNLTNTSPAINAANATFEVLTDFYDNIRPSGQTDIGAIEFSADNCQASTTWNGSNWSNGIPSIDKNIIFNGSYVSSSNLSGCSCQVLSGNVIIMSPNVLNIKNSVMISSGSLTIKDKASLVQINNNAINTGNIILERTSIVRDTDYVGWSSPVANFNVTSLSPGTSAGYIWKWNPSQINTNGGQGNWVNTTEIMAAGKGYFVRAPNNYTSTPTPFTANYIGRPNNGIVQSSISRGTITNSFQGNNGFMITSYDDNWNLIGNPYPSPINALDFLNLNVNIDGAVRLWSHSSPIAYGGSTFYGNFAYNYNANDYIKFNGTGSTPPGFNGYIGSGQGFFVLMNENTAATESVIFNNSLRNQNYNNAQFYRSDTEFQSEPEKHRIWLSLLDSNNNAKTTLIGYIEGATNEKDRLFDAVQCMSFTQNHELYSILGSDNLIIQGRLIPFNPNDVIPLGIAITSPGNYTIALSAIDGLFTDVNQGIFLYDLLDGTIHNLRNTPYTFFANTGNFDNRFQLLFQNQLVHSNFSTNDAVVYQIDTDEIVVATTGFLIENLEIYDMQGKKLMFLENLETSEVKISLAIKNQLIFMVIWANNQRIVKKIMIR